MAAKNGLAAMTGWTPAAPPRGFDELGEWSAPGHGTTKGVQAAHAAFVAIDPATLARACRRTRRTHVGTRDGNRSLAGHQDSTDQRPLGGELAMPEPSGPSGTREKNATRCMGVASSLKYVSVSVRTFPSALTEKTRVDLGMP